MINDDNTAIKLTPFLSKRSVLLRWVGWFFLSNAVIFWIFGLYYLSGVTPISMNLLTHLNATLVWIFLILAWIGHFALLAFIPSLLVLALLIFCTNRSVIIGAAIVSASIALLALMMDSVVYTQYHFHLNTIILQLVFSREFGQIFDFSWLEKLIFAAICLVVVSIELVFARGIWHRIIRQKKSRHGAFITLVIALSLFISYDMYLLSSLQPTSIIYQQPQAFPLYNNIVSTMFSGLLKNTDFNNLGSNMIHQPQQSNYQQLHYPLHALNCHPKTPPMNIVIIAIDTWRFDMLNAQVTPHITQFAASSWQFNNHWSGGNTTQPGIFSLFYGIPATYWPVALRQQRSAALIDQLIQQHYQLGIYASASLALPAFNHTVFADVPHLQLVTDGALPADRDLKITQQFKQFIDSATQKQQPFFSFLFYDTAHSFCTPLSDESHFQPIITTCDRFDLFPGNKMPLYINRYKNALYYVDGLVAQDLNTLAQHHLLKNTIIIITADHGNEFNDNQQGYWGHGSNYTRYQTQIPLLIYWPDQQAHIFQQQTSHYDIAPTLLTRALGCTNPAHDYSVGQVLPVQQKSLPFLIVSSYVDMGIIEPSRITTIFKSGDFTITDLQNNIWPNAKPNLAVVKQALQQLQMFYQ